MRAAAIVALGFIVAGAVSTQTLATSEDIAGAAVITTNPVQGGISFSKPAAGEPETPQDADATACATGEAQVGDACDTMDAGMLFLLGSTR